MRYVLPSLLSNLAPSLFLHSFFLPITFSCVTGDLSSGIRIVLMFFLSVDEDEDRSLRGNNCERKNERRGERMVSFCEGCGGESVWDL